MKTEPFFLALLILILTAWITPALGQSRFSVSVSLAPVYGHSDSKAVFPFSTDPAYPTTTLVARSHGLGYSFGLMGHYNFSSKWSVSAGIWATANLSSKSDFELNNNRNTIHIQSSHPFEYNYRIPVLLNYTWAIKRLSPYLSVGTSANFRSTSYAYVNGQEIPIKVGKAIRNGPLMVGAGIIYQVRKNASLVVQPMLEYSLNAKSANYVYAHSYMLSLQAQLRYRF
ncbi:hypothetical protein [Spirosoma pulveris]